MRISSLDGLRGLAVLAVLFYHTLHIPGGGCLGVDMFFTLSGFLISSQLFAAIDKTGSVRIGVFYLKRCFRLIPAFMATCGLYYIIAFCFPESAGFESPLRLMSLLVTANIYWAQGAGGVPFMNNTWTLAVEWQFYLLWPLILVGMFKLGFTKKSVLVALVAGVVFACYLRWNGNRYIRFDGILIGSIIPLVKDYKFTRKVFSAQLSNWGVFVPASVIIVLLIFSTKDVMGGRINTTISFLTAIIIMFLVSNSSKISRAVLENPVMRYFGKISYGLYLFNFPIAALMYVNGVAPVHMFLVGCILSISLAEVSWRYIESPILNVCRRRIK